MPTFAYTAKTGPENTVKGEIEAESDQDAIIKLTRLGYFPIAVNARDISAVPSGALKLKKISNKEIVLFTRQASSLIDSGVNIINALNILSRQAQNKYLRVVLEEVISSVKDGRSFSDSLARHPKVFSELYCSMIRTGEASGNLNNTLKRLADFIEGQQEFRESVVTSLIYPAFVLSVGVITIIVLLIFVIPRLVTMFRDMGQTLPVPTQILINVSGFMRSYWWLLAIFISIAVMLFRRTLKTPQGKLSWDKAKLNLAVIGPITLKTEISHMARTLALLTAGGIPISPALDISCAVVDNEVIKGEVKRFKEMISEGSSLSNAFSTSKIFPEFATDIIAVGEETGSLEKSLLRIADDYEKDVNSYLKELARMLEPLVILIMGLVVGFIVLSMLLPIFQINLIVK